MNGADFKDVKDVKDLLHNWDVSDIGPIFPAKWSPEMEQMSGAAATRKLLQMSNRGLDVIGAVPLGINDAVHKDLGQGISAFESIIDFSSTSHFKYGCDWTEEEEEGCIHFDEKACLLTDLPPKTKPDVPITTGIEALEDVEEIAAGGLLGRAVKDLSTLVGIIRHGGGDPHNIMEYFAAAWDIKLETVEKMVRPVAAAISTGRISALVGKSSSQIMGKENMGGSVKLVPTGVSTHAWDDSLMNGESVAVDWGRYESFIKSVGYAVYEIMGPTTQKLIAIGKPVPLKWKLHPEAAIKYRKSDFVLPYFTIPESSLYPTLVEPLKKVADYLADPQRINELAQSYKAAMIQLQDTDDPIYDFSLSDLKQIRASIKSTLNRPLTDPTTIRGQVLKAEIAHEFIRNAWEVPDKLMNSLPKAGIWTSLCHLILPLERVATVPIAKAAFYKVSNLLPIHRNWHRWVPVEDEIRSLVDPTLLCATPNLINKWHTIIQTGNQISSLTLTQQITTNCLSGYSYLEAKAVSALLVLQPHAFYARVMKIKHQLEEYKPNEVLLSVAHPEISLGANYVERIKLLIARNEGAISALMDVDDDKAQARVVYYQLVNKFLLAGRVEVQGLQAKFIIPDETELVHSWIKHYSRKRDDFKIDKSATLVETLGMADDHYMPLVSFVETYHKLTRLFEGLQSDFDSNYDNFLLSIKKPFIEVKTKAWYSSKVIIAEGPELDLDDDMTNFSLSDIKTDDRKQTLQMVLASCYILQDELPSFIREASLGKYTTVDQIEMAGLTVEIVNQLAASAAVLEPAAARIAIMLKIRELSGAKSEDDEIAEEEPVDKDLA